jgi:hypothetical protein
MRSEESEGFFLVRPACFVNDYLELSIVRLDFGEWQEARPRGKDGGFENGVFRSIEAEEVAQRFGVQNVHLEPRAFLAVIDAANPELIESACIGQHASSNEPGREQRWRGINLSYGSPGQ